MNTRTAIGFLTLGFTCWLSTELGRSAESPVWWSERAVLSQESSQDFSAINLGQIKQMATAATAEFAEHIPDGPSAEILAMVLPWQNPPAPDAIRQDYAAATIGQLKAVAKPFYDQLIAIGYTDRYPWADSTISPQDHSLANVGQLKALFAFDLRTVHHPDNPLPTWWQLFYFGHANVDPDHDADGDGFTNYEEYLFATDPMDSDSYPSGPLITAEWTSPQSVALAWEELPGAVEYLIEHQDQEGNWHAVARVPGSETHFLDLSAFIGTTANYRVRAILSDGQSTHPWSTGGRTGGGSGAGGGNTPFDTNINRPDLSADPDGDWDQDGLTNAEELRYRTDPYNPDTDGDGVPDGEDGWALIPELAPKRIDASRYVLVALKENARGLHINNKGQVISQNLAGYTFNFHDGGAITELPSSVIGVRDLNDHGKVLVSTYDPNLDYLLSGTWSKSDGLILYGDLTQNLDHLLVYFKDISSQIDVIDSLNGFAENGVMMNELSLRSINNKGEVFAQRYLASDLYYTHTGHPGNFPNSAIFSLHHSAVFNGETEHVLGSSYFLVQDQGRELYAFNVGLVYSVFDANNKSVSVGMFEEYGPFMRDGTMFMGFTGWGLCLIHGDNDPIKLYERDAGVLRPEYIPALLNDHGHVFAMINTASGLKYRLWLNTESGHRNENSGDTIEFKEVPIPSSLHDLATNEVMGISFNNQMTMLFKNAVWMNASVYSVVDLLRDSEIQYKNMVLRGINDIGVITGSAANISTGRSHAILLLPIDIKVHQTQNGPQGSAPKYDNAPASYIASNLFSVWPNEEAIVKVKLPPPFDQQQNLPANLIKWEVPGHTIPDNTLEAPLSWTLGFGNNTKEVKITIGGSEFKLHFKVQGVGIISEVEAAALVPHAAVVMLAYRQEAIDFGATYPAGPQDDAMRHAYWCSVSVSTFPVTAGDVDLIATGHEHTNRYVDQQQAFNGTMDLKNNALGMTVNHQVNGLPDRAAIRTELEQRYNAGDMYIWEVPRGAASRLQQDSEGILIKSNGSRIH